MSQTVRAFYDRSVEHEAGRLDSPLQRVEFLSTLRLIGSYFPPGGNVADIGSGPGRYAFELALRGYRVSLLDLSDQLLGEARRILTAGGLQAHEFVQGDAQDLSAFASDAFDAALLLGPLYHIVNAGGRELALAELRRVLKPGGVAIAAYMNSWGMLRTGVADLPGWYQDPEKIRSLLHERACSAAELSGFTEAYWSTPPAALREVKAAGFEVLTYAGAEGFCGGMWPMVAALAERNPDAYANVVALAVETSEMPQYRDATDHLLVVVRKPLQP